MSKEIVKDYFDRHPASIECHVTSDGRVFHDIGSAQSFSSGLTDQEVTSHKRGEEKVEEIEVNDDAQVITLADFDPETTDYKAALELFKSLELTAASNKKEDIYPVLIAAKAAAETQE